MKIRVLTAADLLQVLPMPVAIDAMKQAFTELSSGAAVVPQRLSLSVPDVGGVTLVKPALTGGGLGAKLVSVFPRNHGRDLPVTPGIAIALDRETGMPVGICEGTYLTALRTGAAVGAATDLLAREGAAVAAVIGCGGQAPTQLIALDAVRPFELIRIYDRNPGRARALADELQAQLRARIEPVENAERAVEEADVVTTVTTSSSPVFDGHRLQPGVHINGVGSFTPNMQELDIATVRRARVFVDSRAAATAEAGDLIRAAQAGATVVDDWIEIGEVISGVHMGRRNDEEITLFKSVGNAVQDVTAVAWALARAATADVGQLVEL